MDESDLFDAFDEPPAPATKRQRLVTPPGDARRPHAYDFLRHMQSEAIASLQVHGLDDDDRWRLEQILRESVAVSRAAPSEASDSVYAAGSVHYFRAFRTLLFAHPHALPHAHLCAHAHPLAQSLLWPTTREPRTSRASCARHARNTTGCQSRALFRCRR